jgi:hypothetical protein
VRQAEQQLINEGTRAAEARNLLEPVAGLVEDSAFWRRQAEGLAVLRSPKEGLINSCLCQELCF